MPQAMGPSPGLRTNPDHRITIAPESRTVTVTFNGAEIARTQRALKLTEASYPPVFYIPLEDVRRDYLSPTDHHTHCPFKGEASYWTIQAGDRTAENAVWGYNEPYDEMEEIADHVAFYPNKVDITAA